MVPSGWVDGRVKDLVKGLETGVSVNGEDRPRDKSEKAVLKVSAVSYGIFNPNACKVIEPHEISRAKSTPKEGQVIISRSNTEELVGASAYVEKTYADLYLPDKLWQTIPKADSNMKWLSYVLSSGHSRYTLSKLATGTSGSMKNITQEELLNLKILIPPPHEQKKIAQTLSVWDKAITTTEQLLANSQQQKKALMQQLLTGKIRFVEFVKSKTFARNRYGLIPDDWAFVSIEKVAKSVSEKTNPIRNSLFYLVQNITVLWSHLNTSIKKFIATTPQVTKLFVVGNLDSHQIMSKKVR